MSAPNVAVIYLPGNNCEEETLRAVLDNGMQGKIVRWNQREGIENYDAFIVGGGWAYEDRIRAGAIGAKDPIIKDIQKQAEAGKPVLGICNGAQVLIETGMVPGFEGKISMALAPNINPAVSGYYDTWVHMKSVQEQGRSVFTSDIAKDHLIHVPIAHGEGRFMTADQDVLSEIEKNNQILFQYATPQGEVSEEFPYNPNGSMKAIAGLCNKEGNVLAMMPHPERANKILYTPYTEEKVEAIGYPKEMTAFSSSNVVISSLKKALEQ